MSFLKEEGRGGTTFLLIAINKNHKFNTPVFQFQFHCFSHFCVLGYELMKDMKKFPKIRYEFLDNFSNETIPIEMFWFI